MALEFYCVLFVVALFGCIRFVYFGFSMNYIIQKISTVDAKKYIHQYHYTHGSHNSPSPCYGLFDGEKLIGVLMFATPCSEKVRASVFGSEYVDRVIELHRLHILDVTPKNTESWFISRCLKLLHKDKPKIWAVLSFADTTEGHTGIIYKATNAYFCGQTVKTYSYVDKNGRLRHRRQCGINISIKQANELGWKRVLRNVKNRYLWILSDSKSFKKKLLSMVKLNIL